jgi:hypothetical protein
MPFLLCWCKLSQADFRMCDAQRFRCNFLHRSPKMLILNALESRLNGALEYPIFSFFTSLNMCLILMKTAVLLSGFWRCWWSWFQLLSRTHGSNSPCLQNNYNAQSTPEVTVGNTHPMPKNHGIPTIFTCSIVNLAKILMGVRECKCVCKWEDGTKTKQCLRQILSSMLTKWLPNFLFSYRFVNQGQNTMFIPRSTILYCARKVGCIAKFINNPMQYDSKVCIKLNDVGL